KEVRGHYTYFVYTGSGEVVHEIERNLRLSEYVMRFLSVNLDDEFDAEKFKQHRAALHAAAKKREEEREARREERAAERRGYASGGGSRAAPPRPAAGEGAPGAPPPPPNESND